jgi:hypothetical protein
MQQNARGCLIRVRLVDGGLDALVTLGAGDMRRTLNILQARCACMTAIVAGQSYVKLTSSQAGAWHGHKHCSVASGRKNLQG